MIRSMKAAVTLLGVFLLAVVAAFPVDAAAQGGGAPAAQAPPPPPPAVKVGEPMPDFTLSYLEPGRDGGRPTPKTTKLSEYAGKQVVVLAFFPAAFSPG
jgi:hypothetical protein